MNDSSSIETNASHGNVIKLIQRQYTGIEVGRNVLLFEWIIQFRKAQLSLSCSSQFVENLGT